MPPILFSYSCVRVCVYVCVHACVFVHMCVFECVCMCVLCMCVCVFVYMCVCRYVDMFAYAWCMFMWICICTYKVYVCDACGWQRMLLGIFPYHFLPHIFEMGLCLNPEPMDLARIACQWTPHICLSISAPLPPRAGNIEYRCVADLSSFFLPSSLPPYLLLVLFFACLFLCLFWSF